MFSSQPLMHSATETCSCGARIDLRSPMSSVIERRLEQFHQAHAACREYQPSEIGETT